MRYPQLLVFEADGRLAALLGPVAERHAWLLRQPRRVESCLRLLARGGPAVLVIRAGRDLEREFSLLERVTEQDPEAAVVLVTDGEHPRLAGLAWDLGATWVTAPATALVWASAVPGSRSSRSRSTSTSTSRIGLLLTSSPLLVSASWKAGTTSLANSSGSITSVSRM